MHAGLAFPRYVQNLASTNPLTPTKHLALYPSGAKTLSKFHINHFELHCVKIKSCSLWHKERWKFAKLGKNN